MSFEQRLAIAIGLVISVVVIPMLICLFLENDPKEKAWVKWSIENEKRLLEDSK